MNGKDCRKKGRKKAVFLIIIAVLLLIIVSVALLVGVDNIKAIYVGVKYDKDKINVMIEESAARLDEKLAEYSYIVARAPTKEEMDAVASGEITEDQLSKIIANGVTLEYFRECDYEIKPYGNKEDKEPDDSEKQDMQKEQSESSNSQQSNNAASDKPAESKPSEEKNTESQPEKTQTELDAECDLQVSQIVAKMYILRSSFTSSLSGLASQAYADYQAGVPKNEIISNYIGQGQSLEAQCDGNVSALMSELSGILTKYGRTTELVDSIYATYNSEKQYTKAYYMNMYLNH